MSLQVYPVSCKSCGQKIYGQVKYCPYCSDPFTVDPAVKVPSHTPNLDADRVITSVKNVSAGKAQSVSYDEWFEDVMQQDQTPLRATVENAPAQGEYNPAMKKMVSEKATELGVPDKESSSLLINQLNKKGFVPEGKKPNVELSVNLYPKEKNKYIEKAKFENSRVTLDSIFQKVLSDGTFEAGKLQYLKDHGKKLGYPEEQLLIDFEKKMIEQGLSPDPDANLKNTDSIKKKLSVDWKTYKKHLEASAYQLRSYLESTLSSGVYTPPDYARIAEAATGILRRDALMLKEQIIEYFKAKGFNPVGKFEAGNELTVTWQTKSYQESQIIQEAKTNEFAKASGVMKKSSPINPLIFKLIGFAAAVFFVIYVIFIAPSNESNKTATVSPSNTPDVSSANTADATGIKSVINEYYNAVQNKRVNDAINLYSEVKKPNIKVNRIKAIAKDTEYYSIDSIKVVSNNGTYAETVVNLRHKKYHKSEERWEINVSLVYENGSWKIITTPGRKLY